MPNSQRVVVYGPGSTATESYITWTKPITNPDKSITVKFWAFAKKPGAATQLKVTNQYEFTASAPGGVVSGSNSLSSGGGSSGALVVSSNPGQYDGLDVVTMELSVFSFEPATSKLILSLKLVYKHFDRDGEIIDTDSSQKNATLNIVKFAGQQDWQPDEPEPGE